MKTKVSASLKKVLVMGAMVALPWVGFASASGAESDCPPQGTAISATGSTFQSIGHKWMVTSNPPPIQSTLPAYNQAKSIGVYCAYTGITTITVYPMS